MRRGRIRWSAVTLVVLGVSGPALARAADDFGRREYMSKCAICHGVSAKGDGRLYLTGFLAKKPTDLTTLASANGGVFPFQRMYEVIDGRQTIAAHGPRDMPVWGTDYYAEGAPYDTLGVFDPEVYVRARIVALTEYLARIQAK